MDSPKLLACNTCGLEPTNVPGTMEPPVYCCCFCATVDANGCDLMEEAFIWNARQFRARHEAIDKLILSWACNKGFHIGQVLDDPQNYAVQVHNANLARRKADAEKLIERAE